MRDYVRIVALYCLGVAVAIPGFALVLFSAVRIAYASPPLQPAIAFLYWHVPPLKAAWPYLKEGGPSLSDLLTNVPLVLGFILIFIGGCIGNYARVYYADVKAVNETLRRARLEDRKGGGYHRQSIGDIIAGGSVNIEQRMVEAARRLQKRDSGFWKAVVTGVVAIILAAVIMSFLGISQ